MSFVLFAAYMISAFVSGAIVGLKMTLDDMAKVRRAFPWLLDDAFKGDFEELRDNHAEEILP